MSTTLRTASDRRTMDRRLGFLFVGLAAVIHGSLGVTTKGLLNVATTNAYSITLLRAIVALLACLLISVLALGKRTPARLRCLLQHHATTPIARQQQSPAPSHRTPTLWPDHGHSAAWRAPSSLSAGRLSLDGRRLSLRGVFKHAADRVRWRSKLASLGLLPTVIMIRAARDASANHAPSPCVGGTRGSDRWGF